MGKHLVIDIILKLVQFYYKKKNLFRASSELCQVEEADQRSCSWL